MPKIVTVLLFEFACLLEGAFVCPVLYSEICVYCMFGFHVPNARLKGCVGGVGVCICEGRVAGMCVFRDHRALFVFV